MTDQIETIQVPKTTAINIAGSALGSIFAVLGLYYSTIQQRFNDLTNANQQLVQMGRENRERLVALEVKMATILEMHRKQLDGNERK